MSSRDKTLDILFKSDSQKQIGHGITRNAAKTIPTMFLRIKQRQCARTTKNTHRQRTSKMRTITPEEIQNQNIDFFDAFRSYYKEKNNIQKNIQQYIFNINQIIKQNLIQNRRKLANITMKAVQKKCQDQLQESINSTLPSYQYYIQQIYEKRFTAIDIASFRDEAINNSFTQLNSIIIAKMQDLCKMHQRFLSEATYILYCLNKENLASFDLQMYSIVLPNKPLELKMKQSIAWVLYNHYRNIADLNKLACMFWKKVVDNKQPIQKQKYIQLLENNLNQLAIKRLVPQSQYANVKPFQSCLQQLLLAPSVLNKEHIIEMYNVFVEAQKYRQRKNLRRGPINWLEVAKPGGIASRLSQLLGVRFDVGSQKQAEVITNNIYSQVTRTMVTNYQIGETQIEIQKKVVINTRIYSSSKSDIDSINNKKQVLNTHKDTKKQQQKIVDEDKSIEKKKSKKKKRKKNKNGNIKIQDKKQQKIQQDNENQYDKEQKSTQKSMQQGGQQLKLKSKYSQKYQQSIKDTYIQKTHKLMDQMVIDDTRRISAPIPHRSLEQWRLWAKQNDSI